jgi:hypothetical protein
MMVTQHSKTLVSIKKVRVFLQFWNANNLKVDSNER